MTQQSGVAATSDSAIWLAGDIHGDFRFLHEFACRLKPKFILALGDVEPPAPFPELLRPFEEIGCTFKLLVGNHDSASEVWPRIEAAPELRLCNRVTSISGELVAALGGIARAEIWEIPRAYRTDRELFAGVKFANYEEYQAWLRKRTPRRLRDGPRISGRLRKHLTSIFPDTYRKLREGRADVLLTHEAGAWAHPHGFQMIDELRESLGARAHFFGHHHCRRVRTNARGDMSIGVGLRGIVTLDGTVIREGELDWQRREQT